MTFDLGISHAGSAGHNLGQYKGQGHGSEFKVTGGKVVGATSSEGVLAGMS